VDLVDLAAPVDQADLEQALLAPVAMWSETVFKTLVT